MITGIQPKILLEMNEKGELQMNETQAELLGLSQTDLSWKLVREHDKLTNQSKEVIWLEWDENGRYKAKHTEPAVGRSLLMSPFNEFYTWQTTEITEIVEQKEDYIKFNTKNSVYELFKLK